MAKAVNQFIQYVRKFDKPVSTLLAAAGLSVLLLNFEFSLIESKLYDLRMSHGSLPQNAPQTVLITIDDSTIDQLQEYPPLPLNYHARLLEKLVAFQPKAVGYLVNMNFVNQVNPDLFYQDWGDRFLQAARNLEEHHIPFLMGTPFDINGEVLPPYPLSSLDHAIAIIHKDGNVFSNDKVTRRSLIHLYGKSTFHLKLVQKAGIFTENHIPRGTFTLPEIDASYFFFRYRENPSQEESTVIPKISFSDLLSGRIPFEELQKILKDKVVLVGTLNRENPNDFAMTPFSTNYASSPKIRIHASIVESILNDNGLRVAPPWVNWMITFLVTLFVFWWVLSSTPIYGLFATFGLATLIFGLGQLFFKGIGSIPGIWIKQAQPLIGIFLSYYLVVPYRLVREYRKRWDYQRKNEVLQQIEQLKTNFLSLVTHDLKTPVARIQGLAEVLLHRASPRLLQEDQKTLHAVIDSTDELNRFITSILELSKVESSRLRLNLESKDINHIIEKLVEGFRIQAQAKRIRFALDLDPLFPIKIDPSLISKVFNNIIDNAIKYSAENSTVTIQTRDTGSHIEITFKDQGIGLTREEIQNLFSKFYRAKNDTTTKTIGSGLGLYLTKYFIKAHQGEVHVQSIKGEGSEFKIILPQDLETEAFTDLKTGNRPGLRTLLKTNLNKNIKKNKGEE